MSLILYDAPAKYHAVGQPVKLLLPHLQNATVKELSADLVTSIENETTFNDYVDWVRAQGRSEIVVCSSGQANWAVIKLLKLLTS